MLNTSNYNAITPVAEFPKSLKNKLQLMLTQILKDDEDDYNNFVTTQKKPPKQFSKGNYYTR